jgi:hypothetical protein
MVNGMTGRRARSGLGVLGIALAISAAPAAPADSVDSVEPAPQAVVDVTPASMAASAPVSTAIVEGVPHLPSPDNLPPGTTQAAPEGPNMSYLRYLWQAVRTPGVTMSDALVLIAQRPLDSKSTSNSSTTVAPVPAVTPTESTAVTVETP